MDIISKIRNFLDAIYSNKFFRVFAFFVFLAFIFYKYSNINTGINSIVDRTNDYEEKPQKVNTVKNIQDAFYSKLNQKKLENEKISEAIRNMNMREKQEADVKERIKKLEIEFARKRNSKGQIVKLNDTIDIKMLTTNGNEFSTISSPVELSLKLNKSNPFTKSLINQRVGDVVIIPVKELLKNKTIRNEIKKIENGSEAEQDFSDIINNTNILYRIKIIGIAKVNK